MDKCGPKQWARLRILQACERLEIPVKLWPKIPFPNIPRPYYHMYRLPDAPPFHPLYESESEWRERVDAFVNSQLVFFRNKLRADLESGFLTPIKQTRDTTPLEVRYNWVAKRICYRTPFPELAKAEGKGYTMERIKRAVNLIITEAGLRQGK